MSLENSAVDVEVDEFVDELKPDTKLMLGQYTIEDFLAAGGFGITYLAKDSLGRRVVIKECFPGSFCRRQNTSVTPRSRAHQNELKSIVRLFSQEAMSLAKTNHPNIVGVHQVFEENNTAYMALDYVQGRDLLEILQDDPDSLKPELVEGYLLKMLDAIKHIHKLGMLHRDVSPDNIIINEKGEPILIDFGAARESTNERVTRMLSALRVVKDGYSPQEFYIAGSDQSPSCDLYSLAASFYHIITREIPPDSQLRLSASAAGDDDPYVSLGDKTDAYSKTFVTGLDKAMSILPRDRMQSAEEWLDYIGTEGATPVAATPKQSKPTAPKEQKKPLVPILFGTSALAAAAAAGLFYVSTVDTEAPTGALDAPEVVAGATTSAANSAPVTEEAPEPVDTVTVTTAETAASEPEVAANAEPEIFEPAPQIAAEAVPPPPAGTPELSVPTAPAVANIEPTPKVVAEPDLPDVAGVAVEVEIPPLLAVEETTNFVVPPVLAALPVGIAVPQPRPLSEADVSAAALADPQPEIDTTAPAAPEPAAEEVVEPAPATPAPTAAVPEEIVVAANEQSEPAAPAVESGSTLDFFMSMSSSEPDLVSARIPSAAAPATTPRPAPVENAAPASPESMGIITRFVPSLPFTLSASQPGMIASTADSTPEWLSLNAQIVSINGQPVETNDEIRTKIEALAPQDDASSYDVTIGIDAGQSTAVVERSLSIAKEQHTLLLNGLKFVTRPSATAWTTEIIEVPASSNFKVGDKLVAYISTWEDLDGPNSLRAILARELAGGTSSFSFAVGRDGEIWVETFNLAALAN